MTDYKLEKRLINKLDLMINRVTTNKSKKDVLLLVEGGEGEGKTNTSLCIAGYVKEKTNREIVLFFRLKALIDYAKSNKEKIIIWDEPSLDSLSTDQLNRLNKDLIRLLMTVRKFRHFLIFNLTKFYKFHEYIVVDRPIGMIHMYSRKNIESGRFVYIKKDKLEFLKNDYTYKHKRNYKKYSARNCRGKFPEILSKYFDKLDVTIHGKQHCNIDDYEKFKDESIGNIGVEEEKHIDKKNIKEIRSLKYLIATANLTTEQKRYFVDKLNISLRALGNWKRDYNPDSDTPSLSSSHVVPNNTRLGLSTPNKLNNKPNSRYKGVVPKDNSVVPNNDGSSPNELEFNPISPYKDDLDDDLEDEDDDE